MQEVCFPYWPKVDSEIDQKYGEYTVFTSDCIDLGGYIRRVFTITGLQVISQCVLYMLRLIFFTEDM